MSELQSIYKGDTGGPWNVGVPDDTGALITIAAPWTCKIKVSGTAIERTVADRTVDNKRFIAALTPAETDTLFEGSSYVVAIEIENTTTVPPVRKEHHIVLAVKGQVVGSTGTISPPTTLDFLKGLRDNIRIQIQESIGGIATEVWNGRYGNKVKYQAMTYPQLRAELANVETEIANEERVASGGSRRAHTGLVWAH